MYARSRSNWNFEVLIGSIKRAGKTGVRVEKPLGERERTNNKLNPHIASTPGFKPGQHWREAGALTPWLPLCFKL